MTEKSVQFRFKGSRDYVQGPDAFNAIVDNFKDKNLSDVSLFIHDFIRVPNCTMTLTDPKKSRNESFRSEIECNLLVNGESWFVTIQASPDSETLAERQEYDEREIINLCQIEGNTIELREKSPHTFIETIVAMTKFLHKRMFPEVEGKWIFVRLEIDKYKDIRGGILLTFRHNFNFRLTKSEIIVDGNKLGDIYFSLVKT